MADCKNDCSSNDGADKSGQCGVVYIHCAELMKESDKNPRVCGRVRSKNLFINIIMFFLQRYVTSLTIKLVCYSVFNIYREQWYTHS